MTHDARSTVYIETYGCQMNVSDSELMLGKLAAAGYSPVESPDAADVIILNTCAIRDHAEQRVIGRLGELKRAMKRGSVVGVAGCMAQRLGPELLTKARDGERSVQTSFDLEEHYEDFAPRRFDQVKAWIPVQRGCDYRCTYCIVPYTRGAERSRRLDDVVREARQVVEEGITEVTLLGQTVNSYHDGSADFADLLRAVGSVPGLRRLRFTSPHPNDFSDAVIDAMGEVEAVCEHVHLPMQSGSTGMLKRMLRRYSREDYLACVDRLRARVPGIALTTDIIVGFPGETEEEFARTRALFEWANYDMAYIFKYSIRTGTPAATMPDPVPEEVMEARNAELLRLLAANSDRRNATLLGTTQEVLVEGPDKKGQQFLGRTR
ncbi:MAG: MiaB/RimO family radical SAM methylthiotransferase, partial [Gemmatimonadota bacterium]